MQICYMECGLVSEMTTKNLVTTFFIYKIHNFTAEKGRLILEDFGISFERVLKNIGLLIIFPLKRKHTIHAPSHWPDLYPVPYCFSIISQKQFSGNFYSRCENDQEASPRTPLQVLKNVDLLVYVSGMLIKKSHSRVRWMTHQIDVLNAQKCSCFSRRVRARIVW